MKKKKEEKKVVEEVKIEVVEEVKEEVPVIDTKLLENLRFEEISKFVSDFNSTLDNSAAIHKVNFDQ